MHDRIRAALAAVLCAGVIACAENVSSAESQAAPGEGDREELGAVLRTLAIVYDTARVIEELKGEQGSLPRVGSPGELSIARFGSDGFTEMMQDGWNTPLHVESDPSRGYVVAAAGSDRRFEKESWSEPAATRTAADDIVLRDGKLVRSPADWAVSAAEKLAGDSLRQYLEGARTASPHQRTVADLRAIASAALTFEIDEGRPPAANNLDDLARQLEPTYLRSFPRADGWGRAFDTSVDPVSGANVIVSAGPDGRFDPDAWNDPSRPTDDIVMQGATITRNGEPPSADDDSLSEAYVEYLAARGRFEQR